MLANTLGTAGRLLDAFYWVGEITGKGSSQSSLLMFTECERLWLRLNPRKQTTFKTLSNLLSLMQTYSPDKEH